MNSECERMAKKIPERTVSLWTHILLQRDKFTNPYYSRERQDVLVPSCSPKMIVLWESYFLRWDSECAQKENLSEQFGSVNKQLKEAQEKIRLLEMKLESALSNSNHQISDVNSSASSASSFDNNSTTCINISGKQEKETDVSNMTSFQIELKAEETINNNGNDVLVHIEDTREHTTTVREKEELKESNDKGKDGEKQTRREQEKEEREDSNVNRRDGVMHLNREFIVDKGKLTTKRVDQLASARAADNHSTSQRHIENKEKHMLAASTREKPSVEPFGEVRLSASLNEFRSPSLAKVVETAGRKRHATEEQYKHRAKADADNILLIPTASHTVTNDNR